MITRKLTYCTDSGHGWLSVKRSDLDALDIANKISSYSYENADRVYLEEDCDMSAYLTAAENAGWAVTYRETYANRSTIRNFRQYRPRITTAALINAAQRFGNLHLIHVKG